MRETQLEDLLRDPSLSSKKFKVMVVAGSKRLDINVSQVIACVGQRSLRVIGFRSVFEREPFLTLSRMTTVLSREVLVTWQA